jgi:putative oxidoreductase
VDVVFLIGRILFVVLFVTSGLFNHLLSRGGVEYARAYKAPAPEVLVPATGVMIIVGSAMVVLGIWADLGALLLAAFLIPTSYYMHAYWKETDPQMRQGQQVNFLKNVGLLGGALIIFYVYNQLQGEAGLSITDPLFGRG